MRIWIAAVIAAAFWTSGCDRSDPQRATAYQIYQMQSQCAELAHKWDAEHKNDQTYWEVYSHYDRDGNRCWIQATMTGETINYFLMDGQSRVTVAACNNIVGDMRCYIGQVKKSRADVDRFIVAKMGQDATSEAGTALRVD